MSTKTHTPTTYVDHAHAMLRPLTIWAISGGGLLILGVLGLLAALLMNGQGNDARTFNAGLAGILLTSNVILAAGMIRGYLILLRHDLAAEQCADRRGCELGDRLDDIENQHDSLEHMMTRMLLVQERQAKTFALYFEEQHRRAKDEIGQRRAQRGG